MDLKFSGIYCIKNTSNGKFYLGSSVNIYDRRKRHFSDLNRGAHCNKILQNSWNKYGTDNFEFEVLVRCPKEYLHKLEQWFLDTQKPEFNIRPLADSNLGVKRTKEQLENQRVVMRIVRGTRKNARLNDELVLKIIDLVNNNTEYNIAELCRIHNLHYESTCCFLKKSTWKDYHHFLNKDSLILLRKLQYRSRKLTELHKLKTSNKLKETWVTAKTQNKSWMKKNSCLTIQSTLSLN